ncbi:MAG: SDR family oxidoreductase [Actinobacteria bacterium]|nr:SDR family oxidoreductase [Actinomycetota bacterium]
MTDADALPHRFEGQVALVTGASRGIGFAIAQRLVAEGARVCLTARKPNPLAEAVAALPAGRAIGVAGGSGDPAHRAETLDTIAREFGGLDVLVNNAGMNPVASPLVDLDLDIARKINEINLLGTLGWIQGAVRHEALQFAARGGRIINVASVTGYTPSEGIGMYGVTKAALIHLTRTLAVELGPRIRVNAVAPAVVKTQFARALYEGKEDDVTAAYPLKRLGTPEDVAGGVAYLASDDASWVTGQTVTLDGGLLSAGGAA